MTVEDQLYMPQKDMLGTLGPECYKVREVSMLAFLHFFNMGLLASAEQIIDRVKTYVIPFDDELYSLIGITASQTMEICRWISERLQEDLDGVQSAAEEERAKRHELLGKAEAENWSLQELRDVARKQPYFEKFETLMQRIERLGVISYSELESSFPSSAKAYWQHFTIGRGEGAEIRYPTEQSVFESHPLIRISNVEAVCPSINSLFTAVLISSERALAQSQMRDRFFRARDKSLESEALLLLRNLLGANASIWSEVFETPDSQHEHDLIAVTDHLCIVLEAKATPPTEPFRDPEKAFIRLRDAFRGNKGIQKAYDQGNRIIKKLREDNIVQLYNSYGKQVGLLKPDKSRLNVCICLTRDSFGPLATNLALLLDKDTDDAFPWAINIIDLSNLTEAWSYFGWGAKELRKFLEQRILLHGKVFSDDELDYAGYFIRHGGFDAAMEADADILQLNSAYSGVFDEIYRHLHSGGPPVMIEKKEPVLMDLKQFLISGEPVFVETKGLQRGNRKVGRNEPCPCGSGKKFKMCCGR